MWIFVVKCIDCECAILDVHKNNSVKEVKEIFLDKLGIPVHLQDLRFEGKGLANSVMNHSEDVDDCRANTGDLSTRTDRRTSNRVKIPPNKFSCFMSWSWTETDTINKTVTKTMIKMVAGIEHTLQKIEKLLDLMRHKKVNERSITYQLPHQGNFPDLSWTEVHKTYLGAAHWLHWKWHRANLGNCTELKDDCTDFVDQP
ncbi:hypothetical protein T459_11581 [Capsicum annuum]|uniref:Ubiquitin-like domain-containing protein n=1 Tax=Capsicum annuum TaxID=4072 RepID=A0A2G2ZMB0_CAPAN|nr:hypothetical protein T459_11581 [Capsicum annuum]